MTLMSPSSCNSRWTLSQERPDDKDTESVTEKTIQNQGLRGGSYRIIG